MAGPFAARAEEQAKASVLVESTTKFEAARRCVSDELVNLPPGNVASIVAFNNDVQIVAKGLPGGEAAAEWGRLQLGPEGGTDIAGALRIALRLVHETQAQMYSVVVITDGLDDLLSLPQAAEALFSAGVRIDTILIDPTQEGRAVAQAISRGGKVTSVGSVTALREGVAAATERVAAPPESEAPSRWRGAGALLAGAAAVFTVATAVSGADNFLLRLAGAIGIMLSAVPVLTSAFHRTVRNRGSPIYLSDGTEHYYSRFTHGLAVRLGATALSLVLIGAGGALGTLAWKERGRSRIEESLRGRWQDLSDPSMVIDLGAGGTCVETRAHTSQVSRWALLENSTDARGTLRFDGGDGAPGFTKGYMLAGDTLVLCDRSVEPGQECAGVTLRRLR